MEHERYEVRVIADTQYSGIEATGDVLAFFADRESAKDYACKHSGNVYGTAVVDTAEGTIDWGHEVTTYSGEVV
jgi:hypothetical protein